MARTLICGLVLLLGKGASAEPLTEAEVVRMTRAQDPRVAASRQAAMVAQAEELRGNLHPNPSLSWDREFIPAGAPEAEDSFSVTVPIELSGRRPAQRALARAETSVARANMPRIQTQAVLYSLETFYDALASEREVAILLRAVTRLEEAARVVGRRHDEGTTSGYERARLEVEAELARSQFRQAETALRTLRTTLALLLGRDDAPFDLQGDLTTQDPTTLAELEQRPSLRLLQVAETQAKDAASAADWAWVPTVSLSGGLRLGRTTETLYGYVAGVSLSVPVFSRGQELIAESEAKMSQAASLRTLAHRDLRLAEARARLNLIAARTELERFEQAVGSSIELVERAAVSGYREGDRSLLELVDAQRAQTDVERRTLELRRRAKRAELALRAACGEFE